MTLALALDGGRGLADEVTGVHGHAVDGGAIGRHRADVRAETQALERGADTALALRVSIAGCPVGQAINERGRGGDNSLRTSRVQRLRAACAHANHRHQRNQNRSHGLKRASDLTGCQARAH